MGKIQASLSVLLLALAMVLAITVNHPTVQAQVNTPPPTFAAFTPTGQATIAATTTTANVALPTSGASTPIATTVVVSNLDATAIVYVKLGTSNSVVVTTTTGFPIAPGKVAVLTIRNNTFIAAIGSATASVGVSTGY